jgi:hypothetical protein
MYAIKIAGFGAACLALVSATGMANAAADGRMSPADQKMMESCTGMAADAMMKNSGCMNLMKKMNMSEADTKMMMSCHAMSNDAMMKDTGCMNMTKTHPEIMGPGDHNDR